MKCTKCQAQFTDSDKSEVNYTEYMGEYAHKMCPGHTCTVCQSPIANITEGKKSPAGLGTGWMHKGCTFKVAAPKQKAVANPSSWIVR